MSIFNTSFLVGKTALVTGASAGIGAATAIIFAKAGANVICVARRAEKLAHVKAACEAAQKEMGLHLPGRIVTVTADMTNRADIDTILTRTEGLSVDILVNNAGMVKGREHVGDLDMNEVDEMIQTNVVGVVQLTQLCVREFKKQNSGHIINIGSIAGRETYPGGSVYCATKFAMYALSGALMRELVAHNIRVSEIEPGMVETEFSIVRYRGDAAAAKSVYKGLEPLQAADIAEQILWCASRPENVQIAQMLVLPTAQASTSINYRKQ